MNSESNNIDFEALQHRGEEMIRDNPSQAAIGAVVAGFILALLPLGAILAGLIRIALLAVKPALLVMGLMKVYEEFIDRAGES